MGWWHKTRRRQIMIWRRGESRKRGNPQLQIGDEVLMYWPPFRAYSDEARKHRLRYVGPYRIKKVVGPSVVELEGLPRQNASSNQCRVPASLHTRCRRSGWRRSERPQRLHVQGSNGDVHLDKPWLWRRRQEGQMLGSLPFFIK